jgi:hypothetical protein
MQAAASAFDFFEDVGGSGRPDEGFGLLIVAVDVSADGQDEFFQIVKDAAAGSA